MLIQTGQRFQSCVWNVEWKLIEMPIPRLQVFGRSDEDRFLYRYNWTEQTLRSVVTSYQRKRALDGRTERLSADSGFDNRLILLPGVGRWQLVRLNATLRPLFYGDGPSMVAELNQSERGGARGASSSSRTRTSLNAVREAAS